MQNLLKQVKANLIIEYDTDNDLIQGYIRAAVEYAEKYQHRPQKYYQREPMPETTRQAVIMLASHFYESRDGSTGGFFSDNPAAAQETQSAVDKLLKLDRDWKV